MADRRRSWLLAVILLIHPGIAAAQGGAPADQQASPGCGLSRTMPPFPAGAEQVAREIGILPLVRRVRDLAATCAPMSQEEMWLRQQITEAVLAASLDVDETIAEISYEQDRVTEVQDRLTSAKNNKVNTLTLAGILVGSGTSAIGTGMGLNNSLAKAGDWVQVFGGTGGIVLAILALHARGGTAPLGVAPNMLAPFFWTGTGGQQCLPRRRLEVPDHRPSRQPDGARAMDAGVDRPMGQARQNWPAHGASVASEDQPAHERRRQP
jgi:hypothetical protein